jgi:MbtH protein
MAANPFEDENGTYCVLVNDEGQYSLWPASSEVPTGWTVAHGEDGRKACLEFIEEEWTDMRPKSLVRQMEEEDTFQRGVIPGGQGASGL